MRICKETISFLGLLLCVAHLTAGTITPQSQILKSEVADVNNDKQPDIILLTAQNGKEQLEIYLGGKGTATGKADIVTAIQDGAGSSNLNTGTAGGKTYILVTGNRQRIFIFNPDDQFKTSFVNQSANQWTANCFTGSLLTDGTSFDILHGACLRRFTPPDKIQHGYFYGPQQNNNHSGYFCDLNMDGENDVVFAVKGQPLIRLYYAPFYGKMKFIPKELSEFFELKTPLYISDIAIGDLNGDTRPDIAATTLTEYGRASRKTYLFFQNSPAGFTNGASPNFTIPGNGIPVIEKGALYLIDRKSGVLRIFRNGKFDKPAATLKTGLTDIHTFKFKDGLFLISGISRDRKSEVRWGNSAEALAEVPVNTAKKKHAVSFPHYMGAVYPAPQKAVYGKQWIPLNNVRIIPDGIAADDLRIQFIQERIAELGGTSSVGKTPLKNGVNLTLQLSKDRHPRTQAYYLSANADQKQINLKAFDKTGLSWATGSFLQLTDATKDGPAVRSAEIYDYPAAKHRGYWSGASDFKKITKRDWAKLHLLYKLDIMLLVRPWNITDIRGDWKEWKKVSTEEYAADYREMGELFTSLGIEWCVTTHAIEGTPQTKLDSSSPADFEIIYRQAENVVSNGGSFMFQYDDVRYPRNIKETEKYPNGGDADYAFISGITEKLWRKYPEAKIYFCPPMYWGPEAAPAYPDDRDEYLKRVRKLSPEIRFTWNGPSVCSTTIRPADLKWAKESYGRAPFILIFGGGPNIERWHFFTEEINAWPQWYYQGMENEIAGALLGTNQPHFLMLTLTFADYWHNPKAYDARRSIQQAFCSLIGEKSLTEARKVTAELQKMNEFGYQVTPYFIRNQQKIRGIIERAEQIYNLTAAQNPELDKWTTYRNFFDLFRRSLAKAGKIDSGVFTKNTEQIRQYAIKEAGFQPGKDILLTAYDFGGGANPLFYTYRCEKRLATFVKGKKTKIPKMTAGFPLQAEKLNQQHELIICGQDDDSTEKCPIRIELNGNLIFEGKNPFKRFGWNIQKFKIPAGFLKEGANTLTISNTADSGNVSGPPFFMLNYAVLKAQAK